MRNSTLNPPKKFNFPYDIFEGFGLKAASKNLSIKKGTVFSKDILSHKNFSLIIKGIVVLYWKDENGDSIIIDFKTTKQLLRPDIEINENRIGKIYAVAHTDVDLILLNSKFICSCALKNKAISDFYYGALTSELNFTYLQLKLLKESELEKRYKIFREEYKFIYNNITDRMIASYLGVHYTTLSRLKTKLLNNQ